MASILEDLYLGRLCPEERIITMDAKQRQLNQKVIEAMEVLKGHIAEKDLSTLEKMLEFMSESESLQTTASFIQGFRLGALIMIEVLGREEGSGWRNKA